MSSTNAASLIKQAWAARYAGDLMLTGELLQKIEGLADGETEGEVLILQASLLRRFKDQTATKKKFDEAESFFKTRKLSLPSNFFVQKGLWFDSESEFTKSLPCYMQAFRHAETPAEKLLAQMNVVVCLYHLRMPLERAFEDLHDLRKKVRVHPFPTLELQVQLIEQKEAFLHGEIEKVFSVPKKTLSQSLFHQAWCARLPWSPSRRATVERFVELSLADRSFYQNEYRRQTVLADPRWQSEDEPKPRLQDQVDRLYLWTWLWLASPDSTIRDLLAEELQNFPFETAAVSLTNEDFLMLRALGGWLGLWSPSFARWFEKWIKKATPSELETPAVFEAEMNLQIALRDFAAGKPAPLKKALAALRKTELSGMADLAEKLSGDLSADDGRAELFVDLARASLKSADSGREVLSKPMAEVLAALKQENFLTFEDALERGFEISPYDDFIHDPKIHNLVQRLKSVLPSSCVLKTKDGTLHFKDPKNEVRVSRGSLHETHFPDIKRTNPLPKKQTEQARFKKAVQGPAQLLSLYSPGDILTREQIQDAIGASKATTNRWIQTWVRENVLDQTGTGRATRYQIKR